MISRHRLFNLFKYTIYILLAYDMYLWFQADVIASAETFGDTVTWRNVVEAYSATIDTAAWVLLLLLFELETAVIPDEKLQGGLKWFITGIVAICYVFITWAFYGYIAKYGVITDVAPFSIGDVCILAGTDWNYIVDLDDYPPIDSASCLLLQGQALFQVSGLEIIGTAASLKSAVAMAIVDIVNAGTWLIIVVLLQAEVWLQLKDMLTDRLILIAKITKGLFYSVLFVCAAYWGINGTFLDFWDAFLWLVAFIFIELNIFQWHEELEEDEEMNPEPA
ncbi:MAG: hypothetical protein V3R56_08130 [Xanthomonadales bacterium]